MVEIRLRDVPEPHVVSQTRTVDRAGLEAWLPCAIEAWIAAQSLAVARAPRETYWSDVPSAAPGGGVFDVAFPVT